MKRLQCLFVLFRAMSCNRLHFTHTHTDPGSGHRQLKRKLNDNSECYLFSLNFNTCASTNLCARALFVFPLIAGLRHRVSVDFSFNNFGRSARSPWTGSGWMDGWIKKSEENWNWCRDAVSMENWRATVERTIHQLCPRAAISGRQ